MDRIANIKDRVFVLHTAETADFLKETGAWAEVMDLQYSSVDGETINGYWIRYEESEDEWLVDTERVQFATR